MFADPSHLLHTGPDTVVELIGHHREAHGPQGLQRGGMAFVFPAGELHVVDDQVQLPLRRHFGVQLAQGPRRRVAGVGQERFAPDLPPGVELLEAGLGDVNLPPDDEPLRSLVQTLGQAADGAQVVRHVLPRLPIAPCRAPVKAAVPVLQGDGEAVDLRLHVKAGFPVQGVLDPLSEGEQFLLREHVRQAFQRDRVGHGGKFFAGPAPHPLGGGIRTEELRERLFQFRQRVD